MKSRMSCMLIVVCFLLNSAFASITWSPVDPNAPDGLWTDPNMWNKGYVPLDDGDEIKFTADGAVCTVDVNVGNYDGTKIALARDARLAIVAGGYLGNGREVKVGDAGASGSGTDIGYLDIKGGQLDLTDDGKLEVGYKAGGEGYVTISSGSLTGDRIYLGGSSASGSSGTLTVIGTAPLVSMANMYVGAGDSSGANPGTGVVEFQVDAGGVSPVVISGTVYLDTAGDESTTALVVSAIGPPPTKDILLVDAGDVNGVFDTVNGEPAVEGAQVVLSSGGRINTYTLTYASSIALLFESSATETATVIGNWEDGLYDNWIDWVGGGVTIESIGAPKYTFSDIGATLDSSALAVSPGSGWQQNLSISLGDVNELESFMASTMFAIDVTYDPASWDPATTYAGVYQTSMNNNGYGWNDVGGTGAQTGLNGVVFSDTLNPDSPGYFPLDPNAAGPITGTWTWDYSGVLDQFTLPDADPFIQIVMATNSDQAGTYYFDNARLIGSMPTPLGVDPGTENLVHAYDFEADANDLVGDADGTLVGGAQVVDGALLTTDQDQWLDLPGDVIDINSFNEVTLEAWYTPKEGANTDFSMLAAFGMTNPDVSWMGIDYLFITSARADDKSRAAISCLNTNDPWATESAVDGPELDDGLLHHMVATVSATDIAFYIDGELMGTSALSENNHLSNLSNDSAWLCRGPYPGDREWIGQIHEFSMYNRALTGDEVQYLYLQGPK